MRGIPGTKSTKNVGQQKEYVVYFCKWCKKFGTKKTIRKHLKEKHGIKTALNDNIIAMEMDMHGN